MSAVPANGTWLGHPRGLATLFFTEMWERFSYYGMRALLLLYMTAAINAGGLGMSDEKGGAVYGLFTAAAYLANLPGGWVADRVLGQRKSVFWGGVLIAAGNFALALPAGMTTFYLGLLVICLGTGMLKTNCSTLVGALYQGDSGSRRDAAFSIYYVGINLGALSPLVVGTIGETVGYRWGFLVGGIGMVLGLIQYQLTGKWLGDAGVAPHPAAPRERKRAQRLLTGSLAALAVLVLLASVGVLPLNVVQLANVTGAAMIALAIAFFGNVLLFGKLTTAEKKSVAVIAIFFVCAAVFWAGYEQAGSTLNLFARDHTDRSFLGSWFASGQHPVSWYQIAQSVFVLTFAPVFAWIWISLGKRGRDPSAGAKFGLGLLQLGMSFLVMMVAAQTVLHTGHRVLPVWLIVTYLLQTTGELCLSPIGLSNVTKLAPARYGAQMMGTWFLGAAIGNLAAGLIGGEIGADLADMPAQFARMALVGGVSGFVMLALARPVRAWMGATR
ncbi:MAG TPA: peptide MFS transporter [Steroidobacteraceae bacterium]|nr:peptide MFS transporter [Steroidobacteraceae bacterium]